MKLIDVSEVSFEEVLNQYKIENGLKGDSWEVRNLMRANDKFGNWIYAKIPLTEIGGIVLPHYSVGGAELIPKSGAYLKDAHRHFDLNRDFYSKNNSQFVARLESQKDFLMKSEKIKAIYLSEEPLFIGGSYSGLTGFKGKITHLDGLHRLFALWDMGKKDGSLESYISIF